MDNLHRLFGSPGEPLATPLKTRYQVWKPQCIIVTSNDEAGTNNQTAFTVNIGGSIGDSRSYE